METIRIDLDELTKALSLRRLANSVPLSEVQFVQNGQLVRIDPEQIVEWEFIGLSNTEFVETVLLGTRQPPVVLTAHRI